MDKERKKQVYDLLLTPILCSRTAQSICREGDHILSPQRYCYGIDPDMSDFAMGFYEVLYGDTLLAGQKLLRSDGFVADVELAGDTMNSFNTVANIVLGDVDSKHRSPESKWPEDLRLFHRRFSSLANYWLLPMRLGRTGTKLNRYDSVDLFLDRLKSEFPLFQSEERISYRGFQANNYFRKFRDYDDFCGIHYVSEGIEAEKLLTLYRNKDDCPTIITAMIDSIEMRAKQIAETETVSLALWDYFDGLGLT